MVAAGGRRSLAHQPTGPAPAPAAVLADRRVDPIRRQAAAVGQQQPAVAQFGEARTGAGADAGHLGPAPGQSGVTGLVLPEQGVGAALAHGRTVQAEQVAGFELDHAGLVVVAGVGAAAGHHCPFGPGSAAVVRAVQHRRAEVRAAERCVGRDQQRAVGGAHRRRAGLRLVADQDGVLQAPGQPVVVAPAPQRPHVAVCERGNAGVGTAADIRVLLAGRVTEGDPFGLVPMHDLVRGQRAAHLAVAEVDQAQLLPAARAHLRGGVDLPAFAQVVRADQRDDRARMGVPDAFHLGRLAECHEQLVALHADDVGKGRVGCGVVEQARLPGGRRRAWRELLGHVTHRRVSLLPARRRARGLAPGSCCAPPACAAAPRPAGPRRRGWSRIARGW